MAESLLLILPIAFIPFVLNFPSGLMLYWLTTNLWTTGQGLITRRLTPKPQPPPKKSSRTPPKSEVEAALDDANLRRLITLLEELRSTSQLIIITHQKATMEVADALYGVSMRGDGITTVISQRLRGMPAAG